ncbi:MAG TPA: carboxypeptidase-like regulatory domain-containing protein [Terriglobales bacterium]|nr:carboxypeptidase-like regulatory domain-containing protein [Terriglobales bacterium]
MRKFFSNLFCNQPMKSPRPRGALLVNSGALQSRSGSKWCQTEVCALHCPPLLGQSRQAIKEEHVKFTPREFRRPPFAPGALLCVCASLLLCHLLFTPPATAQTQPATGTITGTVVDRSGAVLSGAHVKLTREDPKESKEASSGEDGEFSFSNLAPGPFHLTVTADGFNTEETAGTLPAGQTVIVPKVTLLVATAVTEVKVALTAPEVAEEQLKDQEKQRVLGVIPNFYISYVPDAPPLNTSQKFRLAFKTITDPVTFGIVGAIAGVQQAQDDFSGYGQGAEGYAKRYGASYADLVSGTIIGGAILPSLLKQDPRYFYKGTGSKRSRFFYAIATSVICKGDNGRWQTNYSNILGSLAAGGISNLYYPASDRRGATLTFETAAIGIGVTGAVNVLQEFIIPRFTSNVPRQNSRKN